MAPHNGKEKHDEQLRGNQPGTPQMKAPQVGPDGLSQEEAARRLQQYGPNEIEEKKRNRFRQFLSYFWGPIPWMIEVAAMLSAANDDWTAFSVIFVMLLANGIVGFWEEYQAGNAIEALKKQLALEAMVKRDGQWKKAPARELVPGDLIMVKIGDVVPADAALQKSDPINVDQSALTGESMPVERKEGDVIYSSSVVKQGEITAVVVATGSKTYFGKTAGLVSEVETLSHFQRAVLKVGDYLIVLSIVFVIPVIVLGLLRGESFLTVLSFVLVLVVAAIPVAMPTVLSVTMAIGARLLSREQAVVSKLSSIEEMAGIDVLCTDKTGTLTQNKLTLGDIHPVDGTQADDVVLVAALASEPNNEDPIDKAVFAKLKDEHRVADYEIVHFRPFDPTSKRTEATAKEKSGKTLKATKGAPQVIMDLAANANDVRDDVNAVVEEFARRGFRSLGVARTDDAGNWRYIGVIPLFDPPRPDSKEVTAIAMKELGLKVKMVTGDQLAIAKETARSLGMGQNIVDASAFGDTRHHESGQLADAIEKGDGFAQVFPEHKYHIVDVLQQRGHIVGMTGDGVNDAPALKKANAGIAVSGATNAARSAADLVLMTPGLSVIITAIRESRKIFQRMNSYAIYRIAETVAVLLFITITIIAFRFYPMTAIMVVLLALLNDGAILSIAWDNAVASHKPEAWQMRLVLGEATVLGIWGVIQSFGLLYLAVNVFSFSEDAIRTLMYLELSVSGHLTIFVTRTRLPFWSDKPAPVLILAVVGTQLIATGISAFGFLMRPIGLPWAAFVWGYCLVLWLVQDRIKLAALHILHPRTAGLLTPKRLGKQSS